MEDLGFYYEVVALLARLGHSLIIDDVAFGQEQVNRWRDLLKDFSVLFVGIKAPLDVLKLRERQRGNRILGSSRAQHHKVHAGNLYDLEMDTLIFDVKQSVDAVVAKVLDQSSPEEE